MKKLAKKMTLYTTIGALGTVSLTSCGVSLNGDVNNNNIVTNEQLEEERNSKIALNTIVDDVDANDKKIFAPYEHVFHIRYEVSSYIVGNSISIPEGYEVLQINNLFEGNRGVDTIGYDIWFTNKIEVEVEAVYNENLGKWDYSNFGIVVEKDNTNESSSQKTR